MNEETIRQIRRYRAQIFFLVASIVAILISITVIKLLIEIAKGRTTYQNEYGKIIFRSRLSAVIILIGIIYFIFDAIETYKREQTSSSFIFMIATLLVLIAGALRVINLFSPGTEVTGAEDIAF